MSCRHAPRNPAACDFCRRVDEILRATPAPAVPAPIECLRRGTPVPPPAGRSPLKRWALCEHPARPLGPVVCPCEGCGRKCPGYTSADRELPATLKRNLLFHLYPLRGKWHRHGQRLRRVAPLFNGRKVVAVATSDHGDPWEAVADLLAPHGYEVVHTPNDPSLREVATFETLFGSLAPADDEVTLYAQSKGVTHDQADPVFVRWAEILYETLCDHWPVVESVLRRVPLAGSFLKVGRGWADHESLSTWHYSGSWFWFRNRELLGRPDWRRIGRWWSGIEPYPSLHFPVEDAGVVFFEGKVPQLEFYANDRPWPTGRRFLAEVVEPAYAAWKAAHKGMVTPWASA